MATSAVVIVWLAVLNWRLKPGRVDTAITQLRFLAKSLDEGGAERMQGLFPEGYVFTWALYGLASANVARALPPADARRAQALRAARNAVARVDSERAKAALLATAELVGFPIEILGRRWYGGGYLPIGDAFLAWARSPAAPRKARFVPVVPTWWRLPVHLLSLVLGAAALWMAVRVKTPAPAQNLPTSDRAIAGTVL